MFRNNNCRDVVVVDDGISSVGGVKNDGSITCSHLCSCCHCERLCRRVFVGTYPGFCLRGWCADCFVCFGVVRGPVLLLYHIILGIDEFVVEMPVCCIC